MNDATMTRPASLGPERVNGLREPIQPGAAPQRASLRDALTGLFYHGRLIRNCILLGLAVGIAAAVLTKPRFTADALVQVLVGPDTMTAQNAAGMNQAAISIDGLQVVQSEIQVIRNDQVLRSAVRQVGPDTIYPSLAKPRMFGLLPARTPDVQLGTAVQQLRDDLRAEAEPGSNVVRISFSGPTRAVAVRVVQAVLDAYLAQRQASFAGSGAALLGQEITRYKRLLGTLDDEILATRKRYDVLDLPQDIVLATDRLDGIAQRQNQVRERKVAVETEIVAVKGNLAKQPETVLDFKETTNNTGNDEARNTLVRLEQQLTYLRSQFNPSWPAIAEVEKKIATARGDMGKQAGNLYATERTIRNPAIEVLKNRLASLEVEDQALIEQLAELAKQRDQAAQRIASLRDADTQLHSLQLTRDVSEGTYRQLAQKQPVALLQDQLSSQPGANLRVVQPAAAPQSGRSMAISFILGGAFLGLLLGTTCAAAATVTRQVYLAPAQAERDLGQPALATFESGVTADRFLHHAAIIRLSALLQEVTVDGRLLNSLQIMGLSGRDDRDSLVRALAVELASGFERDTLIIDLEGDGSDYATALGQSDTPEQPTRPLPIQVTATQVPRLWVGIDAARSILNDWRAPVAKLRNAVDDIRQQFGMVLVVAPAGLSDGATHRLATMLDANVAILRAEQTRAPVAMRLCDAITTAGGNMLGFIFVGRKYYVPGWLLRWV